MTEEQAEQLAAAMKEALEEFWRSLAEALAEVERLIRWMQDDQAKGKQDR